MIKKPKFICIKTSNSEAVVKDKEIEVYILPIAALKP